MADESQKVNKNGRPTLVLSKEQLAKLATGYQASSDWLGYVKDTADVMKAENYNWSWGVLHSKATPLISKERWEKRKEFKLHRADKAGDIFTGDEKTKVFNTKKVIGKIDKVGGKAGDIGDGLEIILAIENKDAKALAEKTSSVVLSKVGEKTGETLGVGVVGRCMQNAVKSIDPKKIGVGAVICGVAGLTVKYGLKEAGNQAGTNIGKKSGAVKAAEIYINANEKMNEYNKKAEEKSRQKAIEKDPMLEWQIVSSD